jgi:hypothetical protein
LLKKNWQQKERKRLHDRPPAHGLLISSLKIHADRTGAARGASHHFSYCAHLPIPSAAVQFLEYYGSSRKLVTTAGRQPPRSRYSAAMLLSLRPTRATKIMSSPPKSRLNGTLPR